MASIEVVLILLLTVVLSGFCQKALPVAIPLPLVQIVIGALIAVVADLGVKLEPEVFFLLFLPPLLFYDGWRAPKEGLARDKWTILALAFGLVVVTVVGLGVFVHWLIPAMPLAVAFAFAAVISPTDPVAVTAIAARTPVPKRLLRILAGESLLNDASGLVCMRFAVAAAVTGSFSPLDALGTFLWLAVGGLSIGVAVTWVVADVKGRVSRRFGEDTGLQILISLLIPFGAYLLADLLECSGVLAAVAAGVTMSVVEQRGGVQAVTRVRRYAVWDTVQFGTSGIIFILLGEQLPVIAEGAATAVREAGQVDAAWLAAYVAAITLAVIALRWVWVWTSLRFMFPRSRRQEQAHFAPSLRLVSAMSLAGVRGAVTLAGVLSLPLTLGDGRLFPARDIAIFLAAGVIIASLLAACLLLPSLLRGLQFPAEPSEQEAEDRARVSAAEAGLAAVARAQHDLAQGPADADLYALAGARILELYRHRIDARSKTGAERDVAQKSDAIERALLLAGYRAERHEIFRLTRARKLTDETARKLVREIDLLEARAGG